jgi:hypothetical protein
MNILPMKIVLQPGGLSRRVGVGAFGVGGYSTLFVYTDKLITVFTLLTKEKAIGASCVIDKYVSSSLNLPRCPNNRGIEWAYKFWLFMDLQILITMESGTVWPFLMQKSIILIRHVSFRPFCSSKFKYYHQPGGGGGGDYKPVYTELFSIGIEPRDVHLDENFTYRLADHLAVRGHHPTAPGCGQVGVHGGHQTLHIYHR